MTNLKKVFCLLIAFPSLTLPHAQASGNSLDTPSGHELGISISHYSYKEPDVPFSASGKSTIEQTASKIGLQFSYTLKKDEWFLKGDFRYANGKTDYHYNGDTLNKITDWYTDSRVLFGKDIHLSATTALAPYLGLGYRYLMNNSDGMLTSKGSFGYRRENTLTYLPIGFTQRLALTSKELIVSNLEADVLLRGQQYSYLTDRVMNEQHRGYGLRASLLYQQEQWSFGPWINYWNISESNTVQMGQFRVTEPNNTTTEIGLILNYGRDLVPIHL